MIFGEELIGDKGILGKEKMGGRRKHVKVVCCLQKLGKSLLCNISDFVRLSRGLQVCALKAEVIK